MSVNPFEYLKSHLNADDDASFWELALTLVCEEFLQRQSGRKRKGEWAIVIGACSRWVRPHNSSLGAGRMFAFPQGYKDSMPELDWSVTLVRRADEWIPAAKLPGKRTTVFRVAIPTRTRRHRRASIHARWAPGDEEILYGFLKTGEEWRCHIPEESARRSR